MNAFCLTFFGGIASTVASPKPIRQSPQGVLFVEQKNEAFTRISSCAALTQLPMQFMQKF
jgi:hypothetical protein